MAEGLGAGVWLHCTYNQEAEIDECRCLLNFLLGTTPLPSLLSLSHRTQSAASLLRESSPCQFTFTGNAFARA